jgi:hypothetical protein
MWDSGVRSALKRAAISEGRDFLGLGPHSLRRANIIVSSINSFARSVPSFSEITLPPSSEHEKSRDGGI